MTTTTSPVILIDGVSIDVPTDVLNSLTHEEAAECRAAAVRALLERAVQIRDSKVPAGWIEYQCPACAFFYVYDEDDEITAAMIEEHRATHR